MGLFSKKNTSEPPDAKVKGGKEGGIMDIQRQFGIQTSMRKIV